MPELWRHKSGCNRSLVKEEIEIEESDTGFPCLLRDRRIGFGTIQFQSL
jgi:hypothetical protein